MQPMGEKSNTNNRLKSQTKAGKGAGTAKGGASAATNDAAKGAEKGKGKGKGERRCKICLDDGTLPAESKGINLEHGAAHCPKNPFNGWVCLECFTFGHGW